MKEIASRPVISIKKERIDYFYLCNSYVLTASMWIYVLFQYQSLPYIIPPHFEMNGMPDGFGDKFVLFLIPIFVSLMVVFLNVICLFPCNFNYITEITTENAEWQYKKHCGCFVTYSFLYLLFFPHRLSGNIKRH